MTAFPFDFVHHRMFKAVVFGVLALALAFGGLFVPGGVKIAQAATCKDTAIIYHVQNTWNGQHEWKARVYTSPSNYGKHYKVTKLDGTDITNILTKENLGTGSNYIDLWVSSYWRWWYGLWSGQSVRYWRNC